MSPSSGERRRDQQAHRLRPHEDPGPALPTASVERDLRDPHQLRSLRSGRQRGRPGRGGPLRGLARFLLFAVVLAAIVVTVGVTVLRPLVRDAIVGWADDNPSALRLPFVEGLVRDQLGAKLTEPASADPTQVSFVVAPGDSATSIAERLMAAGLVLDPRSFVLTAMDRGVEARLEAGTFVLRRNMTPDQLVGSLLEAKEPAVTVTLREGLRLEQVAAKLMTLPLKMDVRAFYDHARAPTAAFLAAHQWLGLPKGASLEGYLAPDTYRILADTSADEFLGMLVEHFHETVGAARLAVPPDRGLTFYQVLSLASIAQQEVIVPTELPLVAGVYQGRLAAKMLLQADPTVSYGHDSLALATLPFGQWTTYSFWEPVGGKLADVVFPKALAGYQTYRQKGLIPGPISTPTVAAIDAALHPDTTDGFLYFVAKGDGSNTHAFAKTYAQHLANLKKYGYQ